MSSSSSPCAACKFLRRKCTQECVFAPYFPPDNPQKFANVHRVFGASNVSKLLNELKPSQREEAVNSLAYEAEARLRDPVYGCVGLISILQHKLKQMQHNLINAKTELAAYVGPQALLPIIQPPAVFLQNVGNASPAMMQHHMMGVPAAAHGGVGQLVMREPPQQQQQLAVAVAAREQQAMFRGYGQQQGQQQEIVMRFNGGGFEGGGGGGGGSVTETGFNQMTPGSSMSSSLALGNFDSPYQIQTPQQHGSHHPFQAQVLLQTPQQGQPQEQAQHNLQQLSGSEEGRSMGPSC